MPIFRMIHKRRNHSYCANILMRWEIQMVIWKTIFKHLINIQEVVGDLFGNGVIMRHLLLQQN